MCLLYLLRFVFFQNSITQTTNILTTQINYVYFCIIINILYLIDTPWTGVIHVFNPFVHSLDEILNISQIVIDPESMIPPGINFQIGQGKNDFPITVNWYV